jgi:hypothetical protein
MHDFKVARIVTISKHYTPIFLTVMLFASNRTGWNKMGFESNKVE